ncbi:hypothetical protein KY284_029049 [Solanum tuberosum]|nr:hypothetical protein KY284_029049 [Solanum tuberosum]
MRKVIAVDGTHLHGKYKGVLLSVVAQDTENHIYPIAFCVVYKENDASWTFFFEKLKDIVVNESDLCFISDRHKSIANDIAKVYNHVHHGYCMRHLGENLRDKSLKTTFVLEHNVGFGKWSRAHFLGNMYDVMTTNIAESLNAMLIDERESDPWHPYLIQLLRDLENCLVRGIHMSLNQRGDSLYVENITGDGNQFTVFGAGSTSTVNLLEKSCSCREYDLVKISRTHAMVALISKHGDEYGMSIYEYFSLLYKAETYLLAYSESINVVPIESEWCVTEELLSVNIFPPLVDTKLGKRKKNVSRVAVRISKARGGTNVQFVRDPDTREPHV